MKNVKKYSTLMLGMISIIILAGCSGNSGKNETDGHEHGGSETHEHIFACPMHPEITGKEGDKCSKCGMTLEHMDESPAGGKFKMEFATRPENPEAGKKAILSFTPRNLEKTSAAVPLEIHHEKKIHLIAVSEDLSWFDHIHPEYQEDGSYTVEETFPGGGNYLLFADYKPTGASNQLEKIPVTVQGKSIAAKSWAMQTTLFKSQDGISLELKPDDGKFLSGHEIHMDGVIMQNGKQVEASALDNYLGAKAHSVMISATDKNYLHVHPEVEKSILHFHVTFDLPGIYRAWVQFSYQGKMHTADFTLKVEQGEQKNAVHEHTHDEGHSH